MTKVYKKVPSGYHISEPCRSLKQARAMLRSYPKYMKAIIVETPRYKRYGYPYHIYVKIRR